MYESTEDLSKTERILSIYHMFRFFEEVSMQELANSFPENRRTFSRDIALLKRAGVPIRFSGRRKAFVLTDEAGNESPRGKYRAAPTFPEGKKERQFLEKIRRLMFMMDEMAYEDCDVWYQETFPESSKRTMQRDFATLKNVRPGYLVYYKRGWENPYDKDDELPPGHYYFEGVFNP